MKDSALIKKLEADNSRLQKELSQRTRELSFLIDSSKALTSTLEFKKVLRIIMERAHKLVKCEGWTLFLSDEKTGQLEFASVKAGERRLPKRSRVKVGQGIASWVARTRRPIIVPDVQKNTHFAKVVDQVLPIKTKSVLCVPILNKKKTMGVIEMINKQKGVPFTKTDKELLIQLGDQASVALERSNLYQQMANLAITDDLTKLFNFRHLYTTLDREINRSHRYGSTLSLIFFDMDYFKLVNDNYGHLMGSRVLIEVAQLLVKGLRNVDIIARYGGDEFVIVLPETSVKTATRIAGRLHRSFQNHDFLKDSGIKMKMTASFGISGYPDHAETKNDLIRLADQAMYRAKNTGRNRICLAEAIPKRGQKSLRVSSVGGMSPSWVVESKRSPKRSSRRSASS